MGNLTNALAIVLSISAVLILGGIVASDIAGEDKTLMSCQGSWFEDCAGGNYVLNTSGLQDDLPSVNINPVNPTGITGEEGIFSSIGSWLAEKTGLKFLYNVVTAPSSFLKAIGLPSPYADIIATIWYAVTLFLVISWWKGQDS